MSPDGEPARGSIDVQLTQPTADQNINVIYTQKTMTYQLDGNGAVEIELIKTGETAGDPVPLSRKVGVTITENFEGCKIRKWTTVIDTTANDQSGIFQLADAAETVARPLNQYVLLGTYSASLYAKMDKSGGTFTGPVTFNGVVTGIDKSEVGLGNVDNTSDASKPVSTATTNALNLKANLASPALTGTPTAPTASTGTNTTQLATTAFVQTAAANSVLPIAKPLGSGLYYVGDYVNNTTAVLTANQLTGARFTAGKAATINSLAIEVTGAGTTGSLIRIAILKITNSTTYAYSLLADGGTVDGTTTGVKTVTVSAAVAAGDQIIVAAIGQGSPTTQPTIRTSTMYDPYFGVATQSTALATPLTGVQMASVTGAVASTGTLVVSGGSVAKVAFRAA